MGFAFTFGRFVGIVSRDLLDIWDAAGLVWATIRVWIDRFAGFLRRQFQNTYGKEVAAGNSLLRDIPDEAPAKPKYRKTKPAPAPKAAKPAAPKKKKRVRKPKAPEFHFPDGADFVLPGLDLLKTPPPRKLLADEGALRRTAGNLHQVMQDYGIKGDMGDVRPGPCCHLV